VPVGPIGVLCIRRSLAEGQGMGLATGLGAATADAAYGAVAAFGLTAVSNFLVSQKHWLGLIGGLFLCYLGVRTFLSKPPEQTVTTQGNDLGSAYLSTLFLTLTNPMTIISFGLVFVQFGVVASPDYTTATVLVLGVFVGSALWWLLLSTGTARLRTRVDFNWMQRINRISGAVIWAFGVYSLATLFWR
jgi:threonine/homoserine/homoserine lactone efflux protein